MKSVTKPDQSDVPWSLKRWNGLRKSRIVPSLPAQCASRM
jgi:hypothetical protein